MRVRITNLGVAPWYPPMPAPPISTPMEVAIATPSETRQLPAPRALTVTIPPHERIVRLPRGDIGDAANISAQGPHGPCVERVVLGSDELRIECAGVSSEARTIDLMISG